MAPNLVLDRSMLVAGRVFLGHRPPRGHPEAPERVEAIMEGLRGKVRSAEPRPADIGELLLVHEEQYVSMIRSYAELGVSGQLDPDTYVSSGTWDAAIHAVGAAIQASMLVLTGAYAVAFAAVRPPGHHAYPGRAAGFCIFNNAAVAAARVISQGPASRVAIIDLDAHYGDGTAHVFYRDPRVLYVSLHADPREYYPWRGFPEETGTGEGEGYNAPIPLPPGVGDEGYLEALRTIVIPLLEEYRPELVLVSAGFDTHHGDPIMDFALTVQGHWAAARELYLASTRITGRGLAAVLEGGYNLEALPRSTANVLAAYLEEPLFREKRRVREARGARARLAEYLGRARRALRRYWSL